VFPFQAGEGEQAEVALFIGKAFAVKFLGDVAVEVVIEKALQKVIVVNGQGHFVVFRGKN